MTRLLARRMETSLQKKLPVSLLSPFLLPRVVVVHQLRLRQRPQAPHGRPVAQAGDGVDERGGDDLMLTEEKRRESERAG